MATFVLMNISCNEDQFLKEVPLDFSSPDNSLTTFNDFRSANYSLYDRARSFYFDNNALMNFILGTDVCFYGRADKGNFNDYSSTLYSNTGFVLSKWNDLYKMISTSNMVIDRVKDSNLTTEQITLIEAEARFFRGIAYKNLAHLFGGVPIAINEVNAPKTDYIRAAREEVYQQSISDLKFASENLPSIEEVKDGEVSNLAAYQMLSEAYLSVNNYGAAIDAASVVINDPNTALMIERFGSRSGEPGDVYWDLFRRGNQNRSSGNTEAIWVAQYEMDVFGGKLSSTAITEPLLERIFAPAPRVITVLDSSGVNGFIPGDTPHEDSGRGVGFGSPTNYFKYGIWETNWNDMRNSEYNYIRNLKFNNPTSTLYGKWFFDYCIVPIFQHWTHAFIFIPFSQKYLL